MKTGSYCTKWIRVAQHGRLCQHLSSANEWNYEPSFAGFQEDNSPMFKTLLARPVACYACVCITLMTFNTVWKEDNLTSLVKYVLRAPLQFRLPSQ